MRHPVANWAQLGDKVAGKPRTELFPLLGVEENLMRPIPIIPNHAPATNSQKIIYLSVTYW